MTSPLTDRAIQVGDLVMTVRGHCANTDPWVGKIYTVLEISSSLRQGCGGCGSDENINASMTSAHLGFRLWWPTSWLKRIPPLEELEGTKIDEPIQEPA